MIAALVLAAAIHGPLFNVPPWQQWDEQAVTNASAHIGWALAVPLVGREVAGRKGLWIAGGAWMLGTIVQEAWFHPHPPAGFGPEVRTDLVTRLGPTLVLLIVDLVRGAQ
jgi:hypothetical protein